MIRADLSITRKGSDIVTTDGYNTDYCTILGDGSIVWITNNQFALSASDWVTIRRLQAECLSERHAASLDIKPLRVLYSHLKKRVFDEYGIDITPEWELRVLSGEHDAPLPEKE